MSRKLIKPNLNDVKKQLAKRRSKPPPPYKTHAENYYYIKQMNNKNHLIIKLVNDAIIKGFINWSDSGCIKIQNHDGAKIILFKHYIKYLQKDQKMMQEMEEKQKPE